MGVAWRMSVLSVWGWLAVAGLGVLEASAQTVLERSSAEGGSVARHKTSTRPAPVARYREVTRRGSAADQVFDRHSYRNPGGVGRYREYYPPGNLFDSRGGSSGASRFGATPGGGGGGDSNGGMMAAAGRSGGRGFPSTAVQPSAPNGSILRTPGQAASPFSIGITQNGQGTLIGPMGLVNPVWMMRQGR